MCFAQDFCFFKQEHGPPRGSKQVKTDVLLTTVLGPLRCDPPAIPLLRLVEGGDRLPRRRHDAHSRREVADRVDIRQSSDTWQHPRLSPCRWTMSLEPKKFQKTKARPKERRSAIRFPCREQAMSVASPQGCQNVRSPVTCVALVVAAACGVSADGMTRMYFGLLLLPSLCRLRWDRRW